jgi:RNA polymerase sigma factor (sigma-70 family)
LSPDTPTTPEEFSRVHAALTAWTRRRLTELTGDTHAADDLTQQTWQGVWEAVSQGRYDPQRAALSTFVYAVSQNVYRHWLRRQATVAGHAPAIAAAAAAPAEAESDPVADAELVEELRRVLREGAPGMGPVDLHALQLVAQGATDRDLAKSLGVAPSTAHARKRVALDALRSYLKSRFFAERRADSRQQP